jgi:hypothetical protein
VSTLDSVKRVGLLVIAAVKEEEDKIGTRYAYTAMLFGLG